MEYPLTIYLSVALFYGLGLAVGIGLLVKAWMWTFEHLITLFRFKKAFIEFIYEKREMKVHNPKLKEDD